MSNEKDITLSSEYEYGFHDEDVSVYKTQKGLNEETVRTISKIKNEPEWMLQLRLDAYHSFEKQQNPNWGPDLSEINFDDYTYYIKPSDKQEKSWDEVPDTIRNTFDKLGIPEAEQKFLAGVSTQYESEVVYHNMLEEVEEKGVIFLDTDSALKACPDLLKEYFGKLVPYTDNKYAALNTAVWSGGSFIYVPKGVRLEKPLQSYFRINSMQMGQFERTLIIVDEGADVENGGDAVHVGHVSSGNPVPSAVLPPHQMRLMTPQLSVAAISAAPIRLPYWSRNQVWFSVELPASSRMNLTASS